MHLSVVICTWNRAESLQKALESIGNCRLPEGIAWEIVVVDNNSTDATAAVCEGFRQRKPERYCYLFEKRPGKSFALNTGIENAKGEIIAFTDDDVLVAVDWLSALLLAFDSHDCAGAGGRIVPVWNSPKPDWFAGEGPYRLLAAIVEYDWGDQDQPCRIDHPPYGANFAFRRSVFRKYGMFRTDLGPLAGTALRGEDTEFCRRLMSQGETIVYVARAVVFHPVPEGRTTKRYFESWYLDYGRMLVRTSGPLAATTRTYFHIPRHLLRNLLVSLWRWTSSFGQKRRFYYRLEVWQTLGQIAECRQVFSRRTISAPKSTPSSEH